MIIAAWERGFQEQLRFTGMADSPDRFIKRSEPGGPGDPNGHIPLHRDPCGQQRSEEGRPK